MMTLNDFENYVPCKIWARGEEYYECDAVKIWKKQNRENG